MHTDSFIGVVLLCIPLLCTISSHLIRYFFFWNNLKDKLNWSFKVMSLISNIHNGHAFWCVVFIFSISIILLLQHQMCSCSTDHTNWFLILDILLWCIYSWRLNVCRSIVNQNLWKWCVIVVDVHRIPKRKIITYFESWFGFWWSISIDTFSSLYNLQKLFWSQHEFWTVLHSISNLSAHLTDQFKFCVS